MDFVVSGDDRVYMEGNAGGAPANVMACASKLGLGTAYITKAGDDYLGRWLFAALQNENVDTAGFVLSRDRNTTLAMVSLDDAGNRDFSFYRSGCADVSLSEEDIDFDIIDQSSVFHFGSVSMTEEPARSATLAAVRFAKAHGKVVSYDPNLRRNLWKNEEEARHYISEGLKYADIAKLSDEECSFLYGNKPLELSTKALLADYPHIKLLFLTCGATGSHVYGAEKHQFMQAFEVNPVDTTGAGDSFFGAVLYLVIKKGLKLSGHNDQELLEMLVFGNAVGALSVQKYGGISSMPTLEDTECFLREHSLPTPFA